MGIRLADFIVSGFRARGESAELIDAKAVGLPMLDRMYKEYPKGRAPKVLEELAALYRRADGFVIVTGEYNQSVQPALKNMLDHFLEEYFWRPSTIVSYSAGRFAGVRAAVALRPILAELGMPSLPSVLSIPTIGSTLTTEGTSNEAWIDNAAERFLAEFEWYAEALAAKRKQGTPY